MATFANRFAQSAHIASNSDHASRARPASAASPTEATSMTSTNDAPEPLRNHVERVVREYFDALGDEVPTDLYELVLKQVELPLLTVVLEQTRGNQTKCAQILGLNRGTLRKKLKMYDLM